MAMKVYQSGDLVVIEKNSEPVININVNACSFIVENNVVFIFDRTNTTIQNYDIVENIQKSTGAAVGTFTQVISYLNAFILSGSGEPEILPLKGQTFYRITIDLMQDDTGTSVLFKDPLSGNILISQDINSIQAVANGTDIRIQLSGGHKILIDRLDLESTYIDGVLVTQVLATAIIELNTLFANAGGPIGKPPIITSSSSIVITVGGTINYVLLGTNIVAIEWDISTTGTVPVGNLTTPEGDHRRIIGGSSLTAGVYTVYVTVINYFSQVTQAITITVNAPSFSNTYSLEGTSSCYAENQGTIGNFPFERTTNGPGAPAWTVSFWWKQTATMSWYDPWLFHYGYPSSSTIARVQMHFNKSGNYLQYRCHFGDNNNYVVGLWDSAIDVTAATGWHHFAWGYDGGDSSTGAPFTFWQDGVDVTSSFTFYLSGGGWTGAITEDATYPFSIYRNNLYQQLMRMDEWSVFPSLLTNTDVTALYNAGIPINLDAAGSPLNAYSHWYRMGDNGGILGFPNMPDMNTSSSTDLTIVNGTVSNFVSDVP